MRTLAADLFAAVERGFTWWTSELTSLLPAALRSGERRRQPDLIAIVKSGKIVAVLPDAAGPDRDEASILEVMSRRSERGAARVLIRLPLSECLVRPVTIPKAAVRDIERITALDLERVTPFRANDVHAAVVMQPAMRGRATVSGEQIVVKRSRIDTLRARIEGAGGELVGVEVYRDDPKSPLAADLLADRTERPSRPRRMLPSTVVLAAACGTVALAALVIAVHRHEQALADMREQTAAVRVRLSDARAQSETGEGAVAQSLTQLKTEYPPVVAILEDVARRMPDTAFVTEFRLADGVVDLTGFGRPVRGLPVELERSTYVSSASITAPIVTDDQRQKERFSLQLRLDKDWAQQSRGGER